MQNIFMNICLSRNNFVPLCIDTQRININVGDMMTFAFCFVLAFAIVGIVLGIAMWLIRIAVYALLLIIGKIVRLCRYGLRRIIA